MIIAHRIYHRFLEMCYTTISLAVIDPLVTGLACHAASQLRILKDNLEHLYEDSKSDNKAATSANIYYNIKNCVTHYDEVLKLVLNFQCL